jgi:hypothetical protein
MVAVPRNAEARRLDELTPEPQSRQVKIPKVRRAKRSNQKGHSFSTRRWVPVHSPSCTETAGPFEGTNLQSPILEDEDDDILVVETAAVDTERKIFVREVRAVLFEYKSERVADPKPYILTRAARPLATRVRVRLLPKLPGAENASDDNPLI